MVREVQVARGYQQRARTDVIDGITWCAYLREVDLAVPRAAPVDLVAERELPLAPDPQGIGRQMFGQPGPANDLDAEVSLSHRHIHAGPPLRLETPPIASGGSPLAFDPG